MIEKEFEEKLENEKELFTKAVENHKNNKIISINNHYKSLLFSQVEMMIIFIKEKIWYFFENQ